MEIISKAYFNIKFNFNFNFRFKTSLENIDVSDDEPLVTFPDETPTEERVICLKAPSSLMSVATSDLSSSNEQLDAIDTVHFEEKRMASASQTKVVSEGYSSERVCLSNW